MATMKARMDKGVMDLFQEAMGMQGGAPTRLPVIAPKYDRLNREVLRFNKAVGLLSTSGLIYEALELAGDTPERHGLPALVEFKETLQKMYDETFGSLPDLSEWFVTEDVYRFGEIPPKTAKKFVTLYGQRIRQENPLVQVAVTTCRHLTPYKRNLTDREKGEEAKSRELSDSFLLAAGSKICPIDGCPAFNAKGLYMSLNGALLRYRATDPERAARLEIAKKMVLMCLHKIYTITFAVYEGFLMPDIDPEEFTEVIAQSIDKVQGQIPRCREAFEQIRKSTDMLKENFEGYYHDYAASNDPTIILQNYVKDVSTKTRGSAKIAGQFRKIIAHYRKLAGAKANDPRIAGLMGKVNSSFQAMEKADRRADEEGKAGEAEASAGGPAAGAPAPVSGPADGAPAEGGGAGGAGSSE